MAIFIPYDTHQHDAPGFPGMSDYNNQENVVKVYWIYLQDATTYAQTMVLG